MMGEEEVGHLIGGILRKWLAASGLKSFNLEEGEDHDGDPALFINAHFQGDSSIDASALLGVTGELRDELHKRGDKRLPYVRIDAPDVNHEAAE